MDDIQRITTGSQHKTMDYLMHVGIIDNHDALDCTCGGKISQKGDDYQWRCSRSSCDMGDTGNLVQFSFFKCSFFGGG